MTEAWEIVAWRLQEWKKFTPAPFCSGVDCRARNVLYSPRRPDIRNTPMGKLCISCWIDWEACEVCGVAPAIRGVKFQGRHICGECLVPDIPNDLWNNWLLVYIYTPRSSFVEVLDDAFAEDFRSAPATPRRVQAWPVVTTVLAS